MIGTSALSNRIEPGSSPLVTGTTPLHFVNGLPPALLVLLSIVSIQISSALATFLFADLGPVGTTACSTLFAAIALTVMSRPRLDGRLRRHAGLLLIFGLTETCLALPFFLSLQYIPLGIASTISFCGPLALAVLTSRRPIDFLWIAVALTGVGLMTPTVGSHLHPLGLMLAALSAVAWAVFVLLVQRLGRVFSGNDGLTFGMWSACLFLLPLAIGEAATGEGATGLGGLLQPAHHGFAMVIGLLGAAAVALLNVVLPLSLEFKALQRMSARSYGILMTVEPAIGAVIGLIWLGQGIDLRTSLAICCVTAAALGVTLTDKHAN
ncbi:MAG TPA: EamA family transporter [Dongiaceae bacterium]|nr:EamA family transporter [Dongiaceae bacterium]